VQVSGGTTLAEGTAPAEHPRVLVCDPRPLVCAGLAAAFADQGLVGDCDPDTAAAQTRELRPDVFVAGLRPDDPRTFAIVASLKASHPELRALVIGDAATVIELREMVIAGVDSFLLTSAPLAELRNAVARTAQGDRIISPSIALLLAGGWRNEPRDDGATALSPRELEVLELVADGLTNQAIAEQLGLSSRTVKTHVQNLLTKLDVPDRTGAVARGFRLGLLR
jgi:DNA-binding NarL/FixJ family response regulator